MHLRTQFGEICVSDITLTQDFEINGIPAQNTPFWLLIMYNNDDSINFNFDFGDVVDIKDGDKKLSLISSGLHFRCSINDRVISLYLFYTN